MHATDQRCMTYGTDEMHNVKRFKYLCRIPSHGDNNALAMRWNLKQVGSAWRRVFKIMMWK